MQVSSEKNIGVRNMLSHPVGMPSVSSGGDTLQDNLLVSTTHDTQEVLSDKERPNNEASWVGALVRS